MNEYNLPNWEGPEMRTIDLDSGHDRDLDDNSIFSAENNTESLPRNVIRIEYLRMRRKSLDALRPETTRKFDARTARARDADRRAAENRDLARRIRNGTYSGPSA